MTIRSLLILSYILAAATVNAQSAANHERDDWRLLGQAQMSWLIFDIYSAKLYQQRNTELSDILDSNEHLLAVEITYQRNISQQKLLMATERELSSVNRKSSQFSLSESQIQSWIASLETIWPDVVKGDVIRFEVQSSGLGVFYYNDEVIGSIKDRAFSPAFMALWISPQCSYPKLCAQLRGPLNV
ncbi:hypothetical protein DBZ36_15140 [Alginatibacterium sediminis]|uniref:Chalcone isomerase domain-containing protein n=1 Tax=Alginatibacterium sediminis TaxID=2164068 RepID=A0A420E8V9_9ALTE|nr:chalcone isomerase family protein [Alginatibacterium sediminis]RKF15714.1 hypothetical protein DBZ36_15140 [Alginatibacterium sediminis]